MSKIVPKKTFTKCYKKQRAVTQERKKSLQILKRKNSITKNKNKRGL